jgi:hypothetical protein
MGRMGSLGSGGSQSDTSHTPQTSHPPRTAHTAHPGPAVLEPVLNAVALLWLLFVAGSYLLLAFYQVTDKTDGAPSPLDSLDGHAVALLAVVLLAGIIKCLGGRTRSGARRAGERSGRPQPEAETAPDN